MKYDTRYAMNAYVISIHVQIADMSKPLDKRVYKGTFPTCHEFNQVIATQDHLSLLIGFSGGQIQLVEPISKEVNKLYNEDVRGQQLMYLLTCFVECIIVLSSVLGLWFRIPSPFSRRAYTSAKCKCNGLGLDFEVEIGARRAIDVGNWNPSNTYF
jgi:hypothetical protein